MSYWNTVAIETAWGGTSYCHRDSMGRHVLLEHCSYIEIKCTLIFRLSSSERCVDLKLFIGDVFLIAELLAMVHAFTGANCLVRSLGLTAWCFHWG